MAPLEVSASTWSCKQVARWLCEEGFREYVELLCTTHRLDGGGLLSLTEADLRGPPLCLGVLGDIKRMTLALRRLQRQNQAQMEELGLSTTERPPEAARVTSEGYECSRNVADRRCDGVEHICKGPELCPRNRDRQGYGSGDASCHRYSDGRWCRQQHLATDRHLDPELWKTAISFVYAMIVFAFTSFVMVLVHERVPDMRTYPPLPDIFLDKVPRIPWAFEAAEACGLILCYIFLLILLLHKHRSIVFRRLCSLIGTVFLLRCFTIFVTSLSVPGQHLDCASKIYGDTWAKLRRAMAIWSGFGMTLTGVHTCGDYMFSGHAVTLTMLNFFITEYTPRSWGLIHTISWVLNLFGIFFILAAHEHYSIDVSIAFYITTRLFLYYHTLANYHAVQHSRRARIWFPMFSFFECNVNGPVPNQYHWPFSRPAFLKSLIG